MSSGAVDFVYNFPVGPQFPTDGRVTVLEQLSLSTQGVIELEQANAKARPGQVSLIMVGPDIPAELIANGDRGGVVMSLSGNIWVGINGPALTLAMAKLLALTFGSVAST